MCEFFFELYSEEIPSSLQTHARNELKEKLQTAFKEENIKSKSILVYSTPTRLTAHVTGISEKITLNAKEIRGPKVGVIEDILNNFLRSNKSNRKDVYEKQTEKGKFYFIKTKKKEIFTKDLLIKIVLNAISSIRWKKSMRWSNNSMLWGRPLRSILAIFNKKHLAFKFGHLISNDFVITEENFQKKTKKVNSFKDYISVLKNQSILLDHNDREKKIKNKLKQICKSKNFQDYFNDKLIKEVSNPNILLLEFDKKFLDIPKEIIISTLEGNQKYFPLFDKNGSLTNYFCVVANKPDQNNIIKDGNHRVVEARLSDAKFFWDRDKSKNLIKQIITLKNMIFFEKLGTIYDKTQRLRKLSSWVSDEFNINKEQVEIAASISKSDLCSDLVGEYPELQGILGKYFALAQGFDDNIAHAISDHYLPIGNSSVTAKKPISYTISIVDKIDTLVGFFLINQKPTSSKDPFALRRSAIGLLKTIIENKLNLKISDLIDYNIKLYDEQNVKNQNEATEKEILIFLRERMKNILKEKNIKNDIIEASISSHTNSDFLELYKKNFVMNKYINKEIGQNAISSYKRAYNIVEKASNELNGRPDAVLFRKEEEKNLFEKLNEIKKTITVKDNNKDFEKLLVNLSETKIITDNFFDKVIVNDDNIDIKNNRLELLKMFCNIFNNFINFSKLEGIS